MTYDADSGLHLRQPDPDLDLKTRRLRELGLGLSPVAEFDALAARLAEAADVPYAMVNITLDQQNFVGLCSPSGRGEDPAVDRTMALDHGYCPDVMSRGRALVLPDVCAYPRFASNDVVDRIGIRTYAGAPLLDVRTGLVLGTVCFVGREARPRSFGKHALALVKASQDDAMETVYRRAPSSAR
ncbi:GAF domain-containing protein [Streptomyces sp. NPDC006923]|uniref:GAF domain-containing protein n=1 Tax=Streptomyces sp. NPDC006923 TaxID=3155355 RepID=UPI00340144C0